MLPKWNAEKTDIVKFPSWPGKWLLHPEEKTFFPFSGILECFRQEMISELKLGDFGERTQSDFQI